MQANRESYDDFYQHLRNHDEGTRIVHGANRLSNRWNFRRLRLGHVLDVGCGQGRYLSSARSGVGVDTDPKMVAHCRSLGLRAHTDRAFDSSIDAVLSGFDTLLLSHVIDDMPVQEAVELVRHYLPYLKPEGRVVLIIAQNRQDGSRFPVELLAQSVGWELESDHAFPLPRWAGRFFRHNEFVSILTGGCA